MKLTKTLALLLLTVLLPGPAQAAPPAPLEEQIEPAFQGKRVKGITIKVNGGQHGFDLPPVWVTSEILGGVVSEGNFKHRIVSKNDVVYYRITLVKGQAPVAQITRIHYRGLKDNVIVKVADKFAPGLQEAAGDVQKWRVGSWEEAAQVLLNQMAARLDQDVN